MSPRDASEERVARWIAPLAAEEVETPAADDVYWRARVRAALVEEERRRAGILRPLRWLHVTLGIAMLALAVVLPISSLLLPASAGVGWIVAPLLVVAVATGAHFLAQATPGLS